MADRDRYDWERGRDYDRGREYGRGDDRERNYEDRGMMSRGADEVRSWFGDDDARRRREMDEQRDRQWGGREREQYGANSERARSEHGWNQQRREEPSRRPEQTAFGDQRDFVGRGREWSGSERQHLEGAPHWTGGSRDYGDEDTRRYGNSYSGYGGYGAGQSSPSFSGGYGAGNYESGNYGSGSYGSSGYRYGSSASSGGYGGYGASEPFRGSGRSSSYGRQESGNYGRDSGYTSEGRWSGSQYGNAGWSGGSYGWQQYGGFAGRGPRNYQRSDDRVREDVNERLTADPRIDASDVDVRVQNGEVTLSGTVADRHTRRLAEEIIEDLPGVRDVRNDLRVNRGHEEHEHRYVGEQSRGHEDGSIGHTGNPQQRDDVTTVNPPKEIKK
jgi:osmotically-inducible protein OsmY